jgi:hypothetical protein
MSGSKSQGQKELSVPTHDTAEESVTVTANAPPRAPAADRSKYDKPATRRAFIKAHVAEPLSVLEIGALNAPVFPGRPNVKYADRLSTEELLRQYPEKTKVVRVDYVLSGPRFATQVSERFQCLIANAVVVHVPDLINWLDQVASLVERGGWAFFAVPDKRYTSDILRPVTTMADLVDCAHRELAAPSVGQIFAHLYMHRKVSAQDIWDGKQLELSRPRMEVAKAVRTALAMVENYPSVHCNVFTSASFVELMGDMYRANLCDWVVHELREPSRGSNEFLVALKKAR